VNDRMLDTSVGAARRASIRVVAFRVLLHAASLVIAVGCFAAYAHFKAEGESRGALVSLIAAAVFGFSPIRDILSIFFGIEGKALHLVHALGGLALIGLPLAGVVSGTPVLSHAAMAPFAIMGAAQALTHANKPRNARQAAAMQQFVTSIPEVAQFASSGSLTSPENARRAMVVMTDIIAKAQTLGETELASDPNFQSALNQVSTRFGANMELDAVDLVLDKLAANPATASAVPALRKQLAAARQSLHH